MRMTVNRKKRIVRINWREYEQLIDVLFLQLKRREKQFTVRPTIAGVPRGGFVPAVSLSHRLNWDYAGRFSSGSAPFVLVDDILDSGATYRKLFRAGKRRTGVPSLFAVLCIKKAQLGRYDDVLYARIVDDDVWIVFPWENQAATRVERDMKLYQEKLDGRKQGGGCLP